MSYTYKVSTSSKCKPEGKLYHNIIDARHARNKLGYAYYIYVKFSGSNWKHVK